MDKEKSSAGMTGNFLMPSYITALTRVLYRKFELTLERTNKSASTYKVTVRNGTPPEPMFKGQYASQELDSKTYENTYDEALQGIDKMISTFDELSKNPDAEDGQVKSANQHKAAFEKLKDCIKELEDE